MNFLNARRYKKYQEIQHFSGSDKPRILFPPYKCLNANNCWHLDIDEQEIVGILTFMSRKSGYFNIYEQENFILS